MVSPLKKIGKIVARFRRTGRLFLCEKYFYAIDKRLSVLK